jgi:hypothetical protein
MMTRLEQLTREFDEELAKVNTEYIALFDQLEPYRGRKLSDEEVATSNDLIKSIQVKFGEMYAAFYLIAVRHSHAVAITNEFTTFCESLEKAGFKKQPVENEVKDGVWRPNESPIILTD